MKVTKIVREYIEEQVNNKFQPLMDALKNKYDVGAADAAIEETRNKLNEYCVVEYRKVLAPFYTPENLDKILADKMLVCSPGYWGVRPIAEENYDSEKNAVCGHRDKAVRDILIALELGGTKADLDRLLSEVNPTCCE